MANKETNKKRWKAKTLQVATSQSDAVKLELEPVAQPEPPKTFKSILLSKTIWVNVLAIIAFVLQSKFGFVIDETTQLQILAGVNVVLRFVTKEPISWK
jgi:hypothetical protein